MRDAAGMERLHAKLARALASLERAVPEAGAPETGGPEAGLRILEARARKLAETPPAPRRTRSYLVFRHGSRVLAVDALRIARSARPDAIIPVPGGPSGCLGVFPHHGGMIAALDPASLIGLPPLAGAEASGPLTVLVFADADAQAGLAATAVEGLADWADEDIAAARGQELRHISGAGPRGELILDAAGILRAAAAEPGPAPGSRSLGS
jgi:chemotaxis signal transduction protein